MLRARKHIFNTKDNHNPHPERVGPGMAGERDGTRRLIIIATERRYVIKEMCGKPAG